MKNIVLIGIMGCGKTTISKLLAEKLHRPVIDIDEYIVEKYNQSINEMFAISEDYFRQNETACCKDLADIQDHIISTGGGVILKKENIDYLKKNGIVFYIDRSKMFMLLHDHYYKKDHKNFMILINKDTSYI